MRGRLACAILLLSLVVSTRMGFAGETDVPGGIAKIERVRWSGISLGIGWKRWRVFGSWATAPRHSGLFGGASPYFRLNEDDRTIFRGLGRESDPAQYIFPTLRTRKKLAHIMSANEIARQSLERFDMQVVSGEKLHMGSTALVVTGRTGIAAGFAMMFVGLSQALGEPGGETPAVLKVGYNTGILGVAAWGIGRIGQIVSRAITEKSFSHLHDAIDHFNTGRAGTPISSTSSSIGLPF